MDKKKIKVLNLYAGIGGNRKLWENVEVTAVENDVNTTLFYQETFPDDKVLMTDAHEYLLNHYHEFDFIWSSPPCPTHSDIRRCGVNAGQYKALYPDMQLYQEIILLMNFFKGKFCVENVKSYYKPLIKPYELHRHYFWTNFPIHNIKINDRRVHNDLNGSETLYGFNVSKTNIIDKRKALRNMVNPNVGLSIFNAAFKMKQRGLIDYTKKENLNEST